jgi:fluoride exporter
MHRNQADEAADSAAVRTSARPSIRAELRGFPVRDMAPVAVGGAAGSTARYLVGLAIGSPSGSGFPWAIFTINVTGCFLLGLVMIYLLDIWPPRRDLRLFLTTGVLGGYTTFSTYATGVLRLIQGGAFALADAYALTSLVAGATAVWCGIVLARRLAVLHRRKAASR